MSDPIMTREQGLETCLVWGAHMVRTGLGHFNDQRIKKASDSITAQKRKFLEKRVKNAEAMTHSIFRMVYADEDLSPAQWRNLTRTTVRQIERFVTDYAEEANPILIHAARIPTRSGGPYLRDFLFVVNADNLRLSCVEMDRFLLEQAPPQTGGRPALESETIQSGLIVMEHGLMRFGRGWDKREARVLEIAKALKRWQVFKSPAWVSRHLANTEPYLKETAPSVESVFRLRTKEQLWME